MHIAFSSRSYFWVHMPSQSAILETVLKHCSLNTSAIWTTCTVAGPESWEARVHLKFVYIGKICY